LKKVLITGAYGLVGNVAYRRLIQEPALYDVYGLARRRQRSDRLPAEGLCEIPVERLFLADLADFGAVQHAVEGMDVVVHMAADPTGRQGWESVHASNVLGTYHVFEASRLAGVKRVVYASTIQVIFGYKAEEPYKSLFEERYGDLDPDRFVPINHLQPARPLNIYACSKVWGEALAHMYAATHGISCIVLRIGWVVAEDRPRNRWALFHWCSQRDIAQLIERCVAAPDELRFDVFFGISNNRFTIGDIRHAGEVVGYHPQDRAEDYLR